MPDVVPVPVPVNPPIPVNVVETSAAHNGIIGVAVKEGPQGPKGEQGDTGPQGPQGLQGPQGDPATGSYTHHQDDPSDEWIIEHNLGYPPAVTVIDSGNSEVVGDIFYPNTDTLIIRFAAPFGGKAYLS